MHFFVPRFLSKLYECKQKQPVKKLIRQSFLASNVWHSMTLNSRRSKKRRGAFFPSFFRTSSGQRLIWNNSKGSTKNALIHYTLSVLEVQKMAYHLFRSQSTLPTACASKKRANLGEHTRNKTPLRTGKTILRWDAEHSCTPPAATCAPLNAKWP